MLDKFGEPRQQRGLELAATAKIERKGGAWLVPSQSGNGRYTVIPHDDAPHCTCPDHQDGGHKCKHLFAVEYVLRREENPDGTVTITQAVRKTYVQDWRAYNAAQTGEKEQFLELLRDLCSGVTEPERQKNGRPRLPISDAIFGACYKVYSTVSARRFMSDLREAQAKGFISKTPHFNSIFNYPGKSRPYAHSPRTDYRNEPAAEINRDRLCVRLVGLHHVALPSLVRSQVRRGSPATRMGQVPPDVRRADAYRYRRRNQGQGRERHKIAPRDG
jgi:hypothetical protein